MSNDCVARLGVEPFIYELLFRRPAGLMLVVKAIRRLMPPASIWLFGIVVFLKRIAVRVYEQRSRRLKLEIDEGCCICRGERRQKEDHSSINESSHERGLLYDLKAPVSIFAREQMRDGEARDGGENLW